MVPKASASKLEILYIAAPPPVPKVACGGGGPIDRSWIAHAEVVARPAKITAPATAVCLLARNNGLPMWWGGFVAP